MSNDVPETTEHKCAYWEDDSWCSMVGGCGCAMEEREQTHVLVPIKIVEREDRDE